MKKAKKEQPEDSEVEQLRSWCQIYEKEIDEYKATIAKKDKELENLSERYKATIVKKDKELENLSERYKAIIVKKDKELENLSERFSKVISRESSFNSDANTDNTDKLYEFYKYELPHVLEDVAEIMKSSEIGLPRETVNNQLCKIFVMINNYIRLFLTQQQRAIVEVLSNIGGFLNNHPLFQIDPCKLSNDESSSYKKSTDPDILKVERTASEYARHHFEEYWKSLLPVIMITLRQSSEVNEVLEHFPQCSDSDVAKHPNDGDKASSFQKYIDYCGQAAWMINARDVPLMIEVPKEGEVFHQEKHISENGSGERIKQTLFPALLTDNKRVICRASVLVQKPAVVIGSVSSIGTDLGKTIPLFTIARDVKIEISDTHFCLRALECDVQVTFKVGDDIIENLEFKQGTDSEVIITPTKNQKIYIEGVGKK